MSSVLINIQKAFDIYNETYDTHLVLEFVLSLSKEEQDEFMSQITNQLAKFQVIFDALARGVK